jgi:Ca-activated chloride channel family protein
MTFAFPIALAALALIPVLLVAYAIVQRRRVKYALRFTNLPLLANVVDRAPRRRRHVPPLLVLTALAALIVGVARPQVAVAVPREEGTVILAIDRSGSMLATDVSPTRMAAARAAAATFVNGLPKNFKVGLVSFSDQADVVLPPTANHNEAVKALTTLEADNGTALGDAITRSVTVGLTSLKTRVASNGTPLVVLLLSDGANTTGDATPLEAAAQAAKAKVPVYTVALGTDAGTITTTSPDGEARIYRVPPDPTTLAAVAERTGGKFFEAADASSLQSVYNRIGSQVGTEIEQHELTAVLTGAGAVLLLAGSALSLAWFHRIP